MDFGIFEIVCAIVALLLAAYYYLTSTFDFWSSRGVPGPKPIPIFGNMKSVLLGKVSLFALLKEEYENYKDAPMFGLYSRRTPILIVKDPELIKDVLIKDFTAFADRGILIFEKIEPLAANLFNLEPERWRPLRTKMSPIFTSGKLKQMYYLLLECADNLEKFLNKYAENNPIIEVRQITGKLTTDVIGVCAFGLNLNSIAEEECDFQRIGREFFEVPLCKFIRMRIKESFPWLYQYLGTFVYDSKLNTFFINSIKDTMEYRKNNNIKRNDFVDLLMQLKDNPAEVNDIEMTDTFITAQAFVFFLAGFETSSSTMSNALYELAINQKIQDKLRQEITDVLKKDNGEIKYEIVKNMKYMHKVFSETLRKYPVVPMMRKTTKPYTFSGTNVTIPENIRIMIPVYAIQNDPEIYPDPDIFDPERFEEEIMSQRHPSFHLPFGDGPRNCIGARFAVFVTKIGLIKILKNFKIDICEKTCIPYELHPRSFLLTPKEGIYLKFTKIN